MGTARWIRALPTDDGVAVVEAVIVVPLAMLLLLVAVQACLWAHAATLVSSAAAEGVQAAADLGGSTSAGVETAQRFLAVAGSASVVAPAVSITEPVVGQVQVRVDANAEAVLPWLHLPVSATRRATLQEFRSLG